MGSFALAVTKQVSQRGGVRGHVWGGKLTKRDETTKLCCNGAKVIYRVLKVTGVGLPGDVGGKEAEVM